MKKLAFLLSFLFSAHFALSQSWSQIPYQGVIRDSLGLPLENQEVNLRFTLRSGTILGETVWQEVHLTTTNAFGIVRLALGNTNSFELVDWSSGRLFLEVELFNSVAYVSIGTQQLLSVPFALHSREIFQRVSTTGDSLFIGNKYVIVPGISASNFPPGCTNVNACNFNSSAVIDDGSCLFTGAPCTDNDFCTLNDLIQSDCSCQGTFADADNDGTCDANDLCNGAEPGTTCNDNDECTVGDLVQSDCSCQGTFADADNDGTCDANDLCNGTEPGTPCNDNDVCTVGDLVQSDCSCQGTYADNDNDSICDANDICNGAEPGLPCDDQNVCTINDVIQSDCSCQGTIADADNDGTCDANDLCNGAEPGTPCNDNDVCTVGDLVQSDCSCQGTYADTDNDGTCDANDICNGSEPGLPCDDQNVCTINDVIQSDCSCQGTIADADNDGTCDANDLCNGAEPGTPCNDNDVCTVGDLVQSDCSCQGTFADADNDGTCNANDICNGAEPGLPCDDQNECTINDVIQSNCVCAGVLTIGCTDTIASNYSASAVCDDGGCEYTGITATTCGFDLVHNPQAIYNRVFDHEGNEYKTITINNREWMAENLAVETYRNGDSLINLSQASALLNSTQGVSYYMYYQPSRNCPYGKLYNFYALEDSRGICPIGWKIPDNSDWDDMINSLGGLGFAGEKLKSSGNIFLANGPWYDQNFTADNSSGFSGIGGGFLGFGGSFQELGFEGRYWSLTQANFQNAYNIGLNFATSAVSKTFNSKAFGMSVRCIREQ